MEEQFSEPVTTEELDKRVEVMRQAQAEYDEKSTVSKEAHFKLEQAKKEVLELMTKANKSTYHVEGLGKVSLAERLSVSYPKDLERRKEFLDFINAQYGEEGVLTYLTVNSNTLNSFYKKEFEHAKENGDPSEFSIPGLPEPTASLTVRFTKAK